MSSENTRSPWKGDEAGMALVLALFVALIIGGLAALMFSSAMFETRSTGDARDYEGAIHLADAGTEVIFGRIIQQPGYSTGHVWTGPADPTPAEERAWVLGQTVVADTRLATSEGGAYAIGPVERGGRLYVYGVGEIGDAVDPNSQRIVRTEIVPSEPGIGETAFLVGGDLEFLSGTYPIDAGDVHANGSITRGGGGTAMITMTDGAITSGVPASGAGLNITPAGTVAPGADRPIPDHWAVDLYGQHAASIGAQQKWYDLCTYMDGTTERGQVRYGSTTPCTGPVVFTFVNDSQAWRGWKFHRELWDGTPRIWQKEYQVSVAEDEGVFYAHHSNLMTSQPNGGARITTIASLNPSDTGSDAHRRSGNINVVGSSPLRFWPAMDPWVVFADRDIYSGSGGGSRTFEGHVYARGAIQLPGNSTTNGSLIAASLPGSRGLATGSPAYPAVAKSRLQGWANLRYVPFGDTGSGSSGVTVYSWAEL